MEWWIAWVLHWYYGCTCTVETVKPSEIHKHGYEVVRLCGDPLQTTVGGDAREKCRSMLTRLVIGCPRGHNNYDEIWRYFCCLRISARNPVRWQFSLLDDSLAYLLVYQLIVRRTEIVSRGRNPETKICSDFMKKPGNLEKWIYLFLPYPLIP